MADWIDQLPEAAANSSTGASWTRSNAWSPTWRASPAARRCRRPSSASKSTFYLPNSIFLQTITGDWVDDEGESFTEPDMILTPDYSTATAAPWTADWTLQVIHDCYDQQGNLVTVAPRNVLKRVVQLYQRQGLDARSSRPRWSSFWSRATSTRTSRSSRRWAALAAAPPRVRPIR